MSDEQGRGPKKPHAENATPMGCGICCTRIGLPPFETPLDETTPVELIEELQRELEDRQLGIDVRGEVLGAVRPVQPGPCFWLDLGTMRCKHYEHRPQICRDFVCGDECLERGEEM